MASYKHTHQFQYGWDRVTQAVWQKYPNPYSSHVLSADVVDRYVDENTGELHTVRLLLKKGVIPSWGRALFRVQEAFVIETSIVNPKTKEMLIVTHNLNHRKLLLVQELQTIKPDENNSFFTSISIVNTLRSNYGWSSIRSKIESFGLARVKSHALESSKALLHSIERLSTIKS